MQRLDRFAILIWLVLSILLAIDIVLSLIMLLAPAPAAAHDSWISRGAFRNPAGEWCCGADDCGVLGSNAVHAVKGGYAVDGTVTYSPYGNGAPRSERVRELVPYSQALPSPDGAYWRCKRPDGSPRCFFAPPPGS